MAIVIGNWLLFEYSNRPSDSGQIKNHLSQIDSLPDALTNKNASSEKRSTILVFYHPHCPCTVATIRNLERSWTRLSQDSTILAFAYRPSETGDSWISSTSTGILKRMGANVIVDPDGQNCTKFGVLTSGHLLVYNDEGALQFSGGVTSSGGHEGDCPAISDLVQKISNQSKQAKQWPVYGCQITSGKVVL